MNRLKSFKLCSIVGLAVLTASCGYYGSGAQPTQQAAAPTPDSQYRDYHFAINAEELCGTLDMDQDKAFALEQRIHALVGQDLAAGNSLFLIQSAEEKLNELHSGGGCTDPEIVAGRAVFDSELKSALQ